MTKTDENNSESLNIKDKIKKKIKPDKNNSDKKDLAETLISALSKDERTDDQRDYEGLELAKIVIQKFTDKEHRKLFSNLNPDNIDDLRKAIVLNEYFINDGIQSFIDTTLDLQVSESHLMIDKAVDLVRGSTELNMDENKGILRFLKR